MSAAGAKATALRGGVVTLADASDEFLSTHRVANDNTRRAYASAIDRTIGAVGGRDRLLADVTDTEIGEALTALWGGCAPATWNRNRAAVSSWLTWCASKKRWAAPSIPADAERRRENVDHTKAVAKTRLERLLSRRDIPLRDKTLYRMLYETAARTSEVLSLDVQDLDLENRRAPLTSKGGDTEWVYWDAGTACLLPRLLRLPDGHPDGPVRTRGPLFLADRRPVPARRPGPEHICPHTGRPRLGYDRVRVLMDTHLGLDPHQLRHSAATHLGEQKVPLQLIMAKTRHKNPRTAMRYTRPGGGEAVAEITGILAPPRRTH
ncbi:site-specific recombinase XerD [Actinocorallia herbida]|uniref:Site-specific recombinase XerD n=1 Tax=Actinocorallia herbida TaxID=58109 RepID=A0A3N1D015_9ACTN|nr:site-specific integrase [Actinocorallia herbida]ROO86388.1 site-specific recombinase XerD [Actinocorallia herbida]